MLLELEIDLKTTLEGFRVKHLRKDIIKDISSLFLISDFGLAIFCMNNVDYSNTAGLLNTELRDWRVMYITPDDNMNEKRYVILWNLMRGGYMRWLRTAFPRQIKAILNGGDNLGNRIINERLRIWANQPKYRFLIEDDQAVLKFGIISELNHNPGFLDYMPEEDI